MRKVDLAIELQILSFHEHRKASLTALPGGRAEVDPNLAATGTEDASGTGTGAKEPAPPGRPRSNRTEVVGS